MRAFCLFVKSHHIYPHTRINVKREQNPYCYVRLLYCVWHRVSSVCDGQRNQTNIAAFGNETHVRKLSVLQIIARPPE